MFVKLGFLMALVAISMALPAYPGNENNYDGGLQDLNQYVALEDIEYEPVYLVRARREIEFNPHINKQDGTTNAGATITHKGDNHKVTGHWNKNIRGRGKGRPIYGIRGSFKW